MTLKSIISNIQASIHSPNVSQTNKAQTKNGQMANVGIKESKPHSSAEAIQQLNKAASISKTAGIALLAVGGALAIIGIGVPLMILGGALTIAGFSMDWKNTQDMKKEYANLDSHPSQQAVVNSFEENTHETWDFDAARAKQVKDSDFDDDIDAYQTRGQVLKTPAPVATPKAEHVFDDSHIYAAVTPKANRQAHLDDLKEGEVPEFPAYTTFTPEVHLEETNGSKTIYADLDLPSTADRSFKGGVEYSTVTSGFGHIGSKREVIPEADD